MPNLYRKKPVVISAVQWTGENRPEIFDFCSLCYFSTGLKTKELILRIKTLEGVMQASKGDYIIKGVDGEFYPCKEEIFKQTYEIVE